MVPTLNTLLGPACRSEIRGTVPPVSDSDSILCPKYEPHKPVCDSYPKGNWFEKKQLFKDNYEHHWPKLRNIQPGNGLWSLYRTLSKKLHVHLQRALETSLQC